MTHSGFLYEAALYNNGVLPLKTPVVGESYGPDGKPRMLQAVPPPTTEEVRNKGEVPFLLPFPRWELSQAGNPFRIFERGGRRKLEVGLPDLFEEPGKPDKGLSPARSRHAEPHRPRDHRRPEDAPRGSRAVPPRHQRPPGRLSGQRLRRLPRDLRQRSLQVELRAVLRSEFGNRGLSKSVDPTIPKDESGHPLKHEFTRSIPSSQCMTCHMHPGTNMVSTYLGYTWWDNETDGQVMYPKVEKKLSASERDAHRARQPRGLGPARALVGPQLPRRRLVARTRSSRRRSSPTSTATAGSSARSSSTTGRATSSTPRERAVDDKDPDKFKKAVHLKDIHLEKGMHCVDCHFKQDNHGNGQLYGEPRAAIEIDCIDCHGTAQGRANLVTSGPAAPGTRPEGAADALRRAAVRGGRREDHPEQHGDRGREVGGAADRRHLGTEGRPGYSAKADAAHNGKGHTNAKMTCYACHSAWTTSCFGCHLSQRANVAEAQCSTARAARAATGRATTSRPCATTSTSSPRTGSSRRTGSRPRARPAPSSSRRQNQNREWIYSQQQTVSAGGFSGTSFSTYVPHTVRATETQHVHRLPRVRRQRQQRLDGPAPDARHRPRELHRPLRLRRRRRPRLRGRGGDRARRAPGGDRQPAPRDGVPGALPGPQGAGRPADGGLPPRRRRRLPAAARRVPLRGPGQGRPQDLRRGPGRQQGLLRADHLGARLPRRPDASTSRPRTPRRSRCRRR